MKNLLNRMVFHLDHGYGMITYIPSNNKIVIRYEDRCAGCYKVDDPALIILPRFGEKIKAWVDNEEYSVIEEYKGYVPGNNYPVETKDDCYVRFSFIDEAEEAKPGPDGWTYPTKDNVLPDDFLTARYEVDCHEITWYTSKLWSFGQKQDVVDAIKKGERYRYRKIEKPALHPALEKATEQIVAVLRELAERLKEA